MKWDSICDCDLRFAIANADHVRLRKMSGIGVVFRL